MNVSYNNWYFHSAERSSLSRPYCPASFLCRHNARGYKLIVPQIRKHHFAYYPSPSTIAICIVQYMCKHMMIRKASEKSSLPFSQTYTTVADATNVSARIAFRFALFALCISAKAKPTLQTMNSCSTLRYPIADWLLTCWLPKALIWGFCLNPYIHRVFCRRWMRNEINW